ncbi:cytochrome family subfamily polypeptide 55 precursor [Stylonychia lemnae]|uniref:Cytochrome family subfamily polypeptide 55 n=1 Tax=Stylonychia lemnae TaxID=5949 RepID=A0A078ACX6_STYLE|nr:cytochrome family subfamily polypeptide 55 precursor [Stylonychia lemnae]|eukprot:CDW78703.1 cytochrome family subfamily polypeptide 55 precursor [Stylonychia lemnae]
MIIQISLILLALYFIYDRIYLVYYNYWYYKKQGFKPTGLPLPFLGDILTFLKVLKTQDEFWEDAHYEYLRHVFNDDIPQYSIDFRYPRGMLVITDPDFVFESYSTKNKYFEKFPRSRAMSKKILGESVLFAPADELQALKRKHLSSAFYKDKMQSLLNSIISTTFDTVQETISQINKGVDELDLNQYIGKLILESIQICIFGVNEKLELLPFKQKGKIDQLSQGVFMNRLSAGLLERSNNIFRINFEFLDNHFVGKAEKELEENTKTLRRFILNMINLRREKNKALKPEEIPHDFLNMLLQDDLFKDNESLMIDECCTFMLAATQTTTTTLSNLFFYLTKYDSIRTKLRNEIKDIFGQQKMISQISKEEWLQKLSLDEIQSQWKYIFMIAQENLRIEPPLRKSTPQIVTQDIEILGKKILKGMPIIFHFLGLQRNPNEWPEPMQFIPERFDPSSKHFLTAEGKKRKSGSFTPFLGGRRICLGKTFAENIIKCVTPVITSRLDFEVLKPEYRERKPPNGLFAEPVYLMKVKLYDQ